MASERATRFADELFTFLNGPDTTSKMRKLDKKPVAELFDRHFPVPPPGKEAWWAANNILKAMAELPKDIELAPIIASAYADRIVKYEAVCEFVTKISTLEWVMTEEGAAKLRKLLAALREDKA